jgi:phage-related protein
LLAQDAMAWNIFFYETATGKSPIKKFLDTLPIKAQQKVLAYINLLSEHGTKLPSNYIEKVRGSIWALRPEFGGNEYRFFLFRMGGNDIIIVHAILKNTRRLLPNDINTAEKRMNEWIQRKKEKK